MRTTVDLDRDILDAAKRALNARTYRQAIKQALEDAIRHAQLRSLVDDLEGSEVTWDVDELLAYRRLGRGDAS